MSSVLTQRVPLEVTQGPIVVMSDLHKSFGSHKVLRGLSLSVPRGKITYIIGRSGEGKSVTIKHLVGILKPDQGTIMIDGHVMTYASPSDWTDRRREIGILFQDGALFDSMSVFENVAFALREDSSWTEARIRARAAELLDLVGLPGSEGRMPSELSIGEKKRVGLARALALGPKLMLYDEPTTSMDPLISELIDELIVNMQHKLPGLSSVVISHDMRSVMNTADFIAFIHDGAIYFEGTPQELGASGDPLLRQFLTGGLLGPLARPLA
jgi:phospholipid/cholesterol/gamma-HCH transport system ATP-binding protein